MTTPEPKPKAVVVGVQVQGVTDEEFSSSLSELERLAHTLGFDVIGRVTQKRQQISHNAVLGDGKLVELAKWTGGSGNPRWAKEGEKPEEADDDFGQASEPEASDAASGIEPHASDAELVLIDHDITPSQTRNLERATDAEVMDRTAVILAIFQRHARTREAKLQVEIARLRYMTPRLRETGRGGDKQRGGIGGKGAGESSSELDRRRVRDRIAELRHELNSMEGERGTRRKRRAEVPVVALVGYTNAGKSSLMRALTGSEIYVADKLFATLDTTVRVLHPETRPRILVSDTVGFIKKLPHDLVASFKSTLEEAHEADLLLHVVDAADPAFEAQLEVTREVLREIEADSAPTLLLMNKVDKVSAERKAELEQKYPDAVFLSARAPEDIRALHTRIVEFFEKDTTDAVVKIPFALQKLVAEAHATARVISETHDEEGTKLRFVARAEFVDKLVSLGATEISRTAKQPHGA